MVVDSWDKDHIYVDAEDGDGERLQVDYRHTSYYNGGDWTYMEPLLQRSTQLNLVRPRWEKGTLYPELIILEPDYLVDISAIARCFAPYAESPSVNLLKRLEATEATEATVLGNLASQLLDEAIHQKPLSHPYAESAKDFFRSHAFSLLEASPSPQMHAEAQRQRQNIQRALTEGMRRENFQHFDTKDGLVEPSFFSEMLGIQGRMDYLQFDFKFLIEQKSGKGAFPYDGFQKPRPREEHYVQLLLYMALIRYNFREVYEQNQEKLHAFLLYSKYKESLDGLGFAPDLLFRALKIRNGIAWTDMRMTRPGGYRLLESLTPERLNSKHLRGKLWDGYVRPQLQTLLDPIRQASPLEKAYFERFMTFIANEHLMAKLGNKTKENSGFASKWHDSLDDKRHAGNIYDRLTLASPSEKTEGEVREVTLRFSETPDNDMSNFRTGDIVILYPYNPDREPDARKSMIFRCAIEHIANNEITLRLRAAQSDKRAFTRHRQMSWAIEHDFMESSFAGLYHGMHALLSAPQERRDLLLLQRKPRVDKTLTLKGDYGAFNDLVLSAKQALDLFLIIGPPGTGKTSYGMLNTVKEELQEQEAAVLVMSYTNRAVDEICGKLQEEGIDYIRIGGELSSSETYRSHLLSEQVKHCGNLDDLRSIIHRARVVVSTITSMNSHLSLLRMKQFSLAVIDEASQILEPHLVGILSAHNEGIPAIRKMVMIGDHKQLPAVVQQTQEVSEVESPLLRAIHLTDCRLSLFERLLKAYRKDYHRDNEYSYMLRKQGRMHPDIARFPNEAFYGGMLQAVPLEHQKEQLPQETKDSNPIARMLQTRRIAFIAAEAPAHSPSDKVNQREADIIAALVVKINEITARDFQAEKTIGVIVPYRNQIATIRNTIDRYSISYLHDITIDTVERFQGSQRDFIIYGFTIQHYYQMRFLTESVFRDIDGSLVDRKLNVAMTRARKHLIIVGNPDLLMRNQIYARLLDFIRSKHGYFENNQLVAPKSATF